jgi:hypothetical protein
MKNADDTVALPSVPSSSSKEEPAPVAKRSRSKTTGRLSVDRPLIYVEWEDHHSTDGWQAEDEVQEEPMLACSVGWLYKEDDKGIMMTGSIAQESTKPFSDMRYILKNCIKKRIVIRKGK